MNYSEAVVAVDNIVNDYSYGVYIIDFVKALALHIHLTVNTVNALYPAGKACIRNNELDSVAYLFLNTVKVFLPF